MSEKLVQDQFFRVVSTVSGCLGRMTFSRPVYAENWFHDQNLAAMIKVKTDDFETRCLRCVPPFTC